MTRREYTRRVIEHTVDASQPWGADLADLHKGMAIALHEYRSLHGLDKDASVPDDAIRIFPGDDEIVLRIEIKEPKR